MLDFHFLCVLIKLIERAISSIGRASPLQGEGLGFESLIAHHLNQDRIKRSFLMQIKPLCEFKTQKKLSYESF